MPTWPSSTKAGTTHVDSGSDKPRLAREDIKQNIENTNAIIDTFSITSPADQNILVYNAGNARFQLATQQFQEAILKLDTAVSNSNDTLAVDSEILDSGALATIDSIGHFTLIEGTYLIWCWTQNGQSRGGGNLGCETFDLVDLDGDSGGPLTVLDPPGKVLDGLMFFGKVVVASGGNTFKVKHNSTFASNVSSGNINNESFLRILKVA